MKRLRWLTALSAVLIATSTGLVDYAAPALGAGSVTATASFPSDGDPLEGTYDITVTITNGTSATIELGDDDPVLHDVTDVTGFQHLTIAPNSTGTLNLDAAVHTGTATFSDTIHYGPVGGPPKSQVDVAQISLVVVPNFTVTINQDESSAAQLYPNAPIDFPFAFTNTGDTSATVTSFSIQKYNLTGTPSFQGSAPDEVPAGATVTGDITGLNASSAGAHISITVTYASLGYGLDFDPGEPGGTAPGMSLSFTGSPAADTHLAASRTVTLTSTAENAVTGSLDGGAGYSDVTVPQGLTVTGTSAPGSDSVTPSTVGNATKETASWSTFPAGIPRVLTVTATVDADTAGEPSQVVSASSDASAYWSAQYTVPAVQTATLAYRLGVNTATVSLAVVRGAPSTGSLPVSQRRPGTQSVLYAAHNDGSGDSVTGSLTVNVPPGTTLTAISGGGCALAVPIVGPATPACTLHQSTTSGADQTQTVTGTFSVSSTATSPVSFGASLTGISPDVITGQPESATPLAVPIDELTDTTLRADKSVTINFGKPVTNTVTLETTAFLALGGQNVTLFQRSASQSTFTQVGSTSTSSAGAAQLVNIPPTNTDYEWRYAGSSTYTSASSQIQHVLVAQQIKASVVSGRHRPGKAITIYGTVTPPALNHSVRLEQRVHGHWKALPVKATLRKQRLPNGKRAVGYALKVHPATAGHELYRVESTATATNAAGYSPIVRVDVR